MNGPLARAQYLLEANRIEAAVRCLHEALVENPEDGLVLSVLARALLDLERVEEAEDAARRAIAAEPDLAEAWFARCCCFLHRGQWRRGLECADEAIRLDPADAEGHGLRAAALMGRKKWREALESANRGLECDAEHEHCTNLRAAAQRQLGDVDGAQRTMAEALRRNPEDPDAHVNEGWSAMHAKDYRQASEHFREALRLAPENEYARQGLREALSAQHWFYRPVLRFFLWLDKLESVWALAVLVGGYVLFRFALSGLDDAGWARPWLLGFVVLYLLFAEATWFASTFSRALLCLTRDGRLVLTRRERWSSVLISGVLVVATGIVAVEWWRTDGFTLLSLGALMMAIACKPIRMASDFRSNEAQLRMGWYAFGCVAIGAWLLWAFVSQERQTDEVVATVNADVELCRSLPGAPPSAFVSEPVEVDPVGWTSAVGIASPPLDPSAVTDEAILRHVDRLRETAETVRALDGDGGDYAELRALLERQAGRFARFVELRGRDEDVAGVRKELAGAVIEHLELAHGLSGKRERDEIDGLGGGLARWGLVFGVLCAWVSQFVAHRLATRYE